MIDYLLEDDDLEMDVQVGPEEDIEVGPDDPVEDITEDNFESDASPAPTSFGGAATPVDVANANPENITVGAVQNPGGSWSESSMEFYVECSDVINYATLHNKTLVESLNDIIYVNRANGMNPDNLTVTVNESTRRFARQLEANGVTWQFFSENEIDGDISVDVEIEPDGTEYTVHEDPETANPNPAKLAKGSYDNVTVAMDGDKFFVDVEDVQKCADVNCESALTTLNGIIDANSDAGMTPNNIIIQVREGVDYPALREFNRTSSNVQIMYY